MQLNPTGLAITASLKLPLLWVHKKADWNPCILQRADLDGEVSALAAHVETAFGRHLFTSFRHQGDHIGLHPKRDRNHFIGGSHLKIQPGSHRLTQQIHIPVLNVATVFAKVNGDAIGAAFARRFVQGGYSVAVARRDAEKSAGLVAEIEAAGGRVYLAGSVPEDVSIDAVIAVYGERPYAEMQGDISTLADPDVVEDLVTHREFQEKERT